MTQAVNESTGELQELSLEATDESIPTSTTDQAPSTTTAGNDNEPANVETERDAVLSDNCDQASSEEETKTADKKDEPEEKLEGPKIKEWTFSGLKKQWRKFNIDLQPKVLLNDYADPVL